MNCVNWLPISDGLVEEAAGGEASAKLYRETDEKGFRESEVIPFFLFVLLGSC